MKFIKLKSIEILTNGSINFNKTAFIKAKQVYIYKKDVKSLILIHKVKNFSNYKSSNNIYKTHYKF